MTSGVVADSIVNMSGAIGLSVAMVALYRRDSRSPLTTRLLLALGVVALLFLVRGAAWWTGSAWLDRVAMIPAALIPLGALIVTEGILRRHAPRAVKIAVVVGGIGLGLGGALGMEGFSTLYSLSLSLFQLAGFAICTWLLATRDRTTLMASENRSIARLAVGALVVIPFIVTDFQVLTPDIPVRLGALGALLVVTAVVIAGGGAETRRQGFLLTALRLVSAADTHPFLRIRYGSTANSPNSWVKQREPRGEKKHPATTAIGTFSQFTDLLTKLSRSSLCATLM